MELWDIEWIQADSTFLEQSQGLDRDSAERQARQWVKARPGSRVYCYRRRGESRVLVHVWTETWPEAISRSAP
jgi:hypothetical protein